MVCKGSFANESGLGSYILFTHMMAQRQKILKGDGGKVKKMK